MHFLLGRNRVIFLVTIQHDEYEGVFHFPDIDDFCESVPEEDEHVRQAQRGNSPYLNTILMLRGISLTPSLHTALYDGGTVQLAGLKRREAYGDSFIGEKAVILPDHHNRLPRGDPYGGLSPHAPGLIERRYERFI